MQSIIQQLKCVDGCDGDIVEIDDEMVSIVRILNHKGYITSYCCSGHDYDEHVSSPYVQILFSKSLGVDYPEPTIGYDEVETIEGDVWKHKKIVEDDDIQEMLEILGDKSKQIHDFLIHESNIVHGDLYSTISNNGLRLTLRMSPLLHSNNNRLMLHQLHHRVAQMYEMVENIPSIKDS